MTLEQLRIFIAVAERLHVTGAARELGMTQSAASAAIATLEARYNARLFNRVGRGIELTDIGRRFLIEARAIVDRVTTARAVLEESSNPALGAISIAASQTIASYWLPRRLTAFHSAYPGVRLDISIGNTRQVEDAVVRGTNDIGFVEGPTHHPELVRKSVDIDRMVLVVAADKPLPHGLREGRLDLQSVHWVVREAGSGTRAALEQLAIDLGLTIDHLPVFLVLPGNEAVREAVEAGAGATIISEHVVARDIAAGLLRTVPVDLPRREFALVRHGERHLSAASQALQEMLLPSARQRP